MKKNQRKLFGFSIVCTIMFDFLVNALACRINVFSMIVVKCERFFPQEIWR